MRPQINQTNMVGLPQHCRAGAASPSGLTPFYHSLDGRSRLRINCSRVVLPAIALAEAASLQCLGSVVWNIRELGANSNPFERRECSHSFETRPETLAGMAGIDSDDGLLARAGQVDIWLTSLSGIGESDQLGLLPLLSESERAKWQRFLTKDSRLQYLATRALVRTTLSRYAAVAPRSWYFETNAYGRPHISRPRASESLRFNLSNTRGLVACAISRDCEIGIDVESLERSLDVDELAPSVFAPAELADLWTVPPDDRPDRFLSYWTLKESYIKARGMGLSLPLDAFWFELGGSSPSLVVTDRCSDTAARWRFYQHEPTPQHRMAVAIAPPQGIEPFVRMRWVTPTSKDITSPNGPITDGMTSKP